VLGGIKQVAHSAHFHDPAGIHDRHAITHLGDNAEIVRDENERDAGLLLDIHEQVEILSLNGDVEIRGGLVGDDELGAAGQGDGADDALAHAAAHLVRIAAHTHGRRGYAHSPQQLLDPAAQGASAHPQVVVGGLGNLGIDAEQRIERRHRVLQDHGDRAPAQTSHLALALPGKVRAVEADLPADDTRSRRQQANN
jgi:hypothetical protein